MKTNHIEVPLGKKYTMLIDKEDLPLYEQFTWVYVRSNHQLTYAIKSKTRERFHRIVMGATSNQIVDHINGNTLDNRKQNLRIVSHQENIWNGRKRKNNKSSVTGVSWSKQKKKWRAYLNVNDRFYGKEFSKFKEAVAYRKQLEKEHIKITLSNKESSK